MVGVVEAHHCHQSPASFLHYVYSILSANNNHHEQNNSYYSIPYSCQDSISMSHPGYNTLSMLQTGNSSPRFCSMSSWSSHRTLPVDDDIHYFVHDGSAIYCIGAMAKYPRKFDTKNCHTWASLGFSSAHIPDTNCFRVHHYHGWRA
eukprot:scaffold8991_cov155-Skeletonema_dohrnii-CCMP3373.AAC.15